MPSIKLDQLIKTIEAMNKKHCYVGIPKENNERENPDGSKADIGNASLAYVHEHGSAAQHIPARPFMRPGVKKVRDRITDIMKDGAVDAMERNDPEIIDKAFHKVGTITAASMQETINAGIPPPLSPLTVAKRARRSAGSSYRRLATPEEQRAFNARWASGQATMAESPTTPLHDTGALLRAINYVVTDEEIK
jgi:hypothetical protein